MLEGDPEQPFGPFPRILRLLVLEHEGRQLGVPPQDFFSNILPGKYIG